MSNGMLALHDTAAQTKLRLDYEHSYLSIILNHFFDSGRFDFRQ